MVGVSFCCFMDFFFLVLGFQGDGSQLDWGGSTCFFFSALHRGIGFGDFFKGSEKIGLGRGLVFLYLVWVLFMAFFLSRF